MGFDLPANFALLCGELALPVPGMGARQPLDRQLRYYSEGIRLASRLFRTRPSGNSKVTAQGARKAIETALKGLVEAQKGHRSATFCHQKREKATQN